MKKTEEAKQIVRKIAKAKGYKKIENKRILLNSKPRLFYQPDFLLVTERGIVVIEIELTTDTVKHIVGDIVRAALIGARYFVGITNSTETKRIVDLYGEALRKRIGEISSMYIWGVVFNNKGGLEKTLESLI